MRKELIITVCCGTTCHLMGSSEILLRKDEIENTFNNEVRIVGAPCLGECKALTAGSAPFVKIGDEIIKKATCEKIINRVKEILADGE